MKKTEEASTLWGGRFTKPLAGDMLAFSTSLPVDWRLYREDIIGSQAHCRMLAKQGIIYSRGSRYYLLGPHRNSGRD